MSDWTFIRVCPVTGGKLSWRQTDYSEGVCPLCGHDNGGTITHYTKVVGKWTKVSWWEALMGKRSEFIRKEVV